MVALQKFALNLAMLRRFARIFFEPPKNADSLIETRDSFNVGQIFFLLLCLFTLGLVTFRAHP